MWTKTQDHSGPDGKKKHMSTVLNGNSIYAQGSKNEALNGAIQETGSVRENTTNHRMKV